MRTSSDYKIAAVGPLRLLLEHPSPSSPHHCSATFPALSTLLVPSHSELSYSSRTQRNARLGQERYVQTWSTGSPHLRLRKTAVSRVARAVQRPATRPRARILTRLARCILQVHALPPRALPVSTTCAVSEKDLAKSLLCHPTRWEFFISSSFDFDFILGRKQFKWPLVSSWHKLRAVHAVRLHRRTSPRTGLLFCWAVLAALRTYWHVSGDILPRLDGF